MSNELPTVEFHGTTLITQEKDGKLFVAMKPIAESIGLDWDGQRQRIKRDSVLSSAACIITAPSAGGMQEMISLPLEYLNGWLFGVEVAQLI